MSRHERWGSLCHFCEESWPCGTVLAEVFRETEHINTRRGSRNGRIREVAEAALRAYREGTK